MEKRLTWSSPELLRFDSTAYGQCISGSGDSLVCISGSATAACAIGTGAFPTGCAVGPTATGCGGGSIANVGCGGGGQAQILRVRRITGILRMSRK